jgi:uncharacterized membrane protein YeiH
MIIDMVIKDNIYAVVCRHGSIHKYFYYLAIRNQENNYLKVAHVSIMQTIAGNIQFHLGTQNVKPPNQFCSD